MLLLRQEGFRVFVSVVMTPEVIAGFPGLLDRYELRGVSIAPKILRGSFRGRKYPNAYSRVERAAILLYVERARRVHAGLLEAMGEPPTINIFADDRLLGRRLPYYGRMCASGHRFVRIEPDGTVLRCGSRKRLGNILRGDVRILSGPGRCLTTYCPYYCEKYTASAFTARPERVAIAASAANGKKPGEAAAPPGSS